MTTLKSRVGSVVIPLLPFSRRTFDILRHELQSWRTRTANALNPAYHWRVAKLKRQRGLSINLGSGGRGLPGWINVELVQMRDTVLCLDIRRPLPLADCSASRIFAEHVVEHVDFRNDIPLIFRDWWRVLEVGGIARVVVPDAARFVAAYVAADRDLWRSLGWDPLDLPSDIHTPMHVINHIFHQGGEHFFAYDFETLAWALKQAGFADVQEKSYRQSGDPQLAIDQENHAPYSLYVEARK